MVKAARAWWAAERLWAEVTGREPFVCCGEDTVGSGAPVRGYSTAESLPSLDCPFLPSVLTAL